MLNLISKLSIREKSILAIAIVVLLALSLHALIIEPYQQNSSSLSQQIEQARSDLKWMQSEMSGLPAESIVKNTINFNGSLANLINREVAAQKLNTYLTQMTPVGENEMRVRYSAIDFNQLISFLATLKDRGLVIKDVRINSTSDIARVDSTVVFSNPS